MKILLVMLASLSLMACTDKGSGNRGGSGSPNDNLITQQALADCPQDIVGTYQRGGYGPFDRNDDYMDYNQRPQPPIYRQPGYPQPGYQRDSVVVSSDPNTGALTVNLGGRDYFVVDGRQTPYRSGTGETLVYTCSRGKIIGRDVNSGRRGGRAREITGGNDQLQVRSNGGAPAIYRRISR